MAGANDAEATKKWRHLDVLRDAGYVIICWTPDDMPGRSKKKREDQLASIAKNLEDRSVERGWEVIDTML